MRARSNQLKRWAAIAAILSVGAQPLAAFDTFWHSAATSAACRQFQVYPEFHTLVWPNGADFAPEFLRDNVRVTV